MSVTVQIDWPNNRDANGEYAFPAVPRIGESIDIDGKPGVVKHVVWFWVERMIVKVRVVVR